MMKKILETPRMLLRELQCEDFDAVRAILGDARVMEAWEHGFTNTEVAEWLGKNVGRYARDGYAYWAAVERETGALIGLLGLLVEDTDGKKEPGVAYLLRYDKWGNGYAAEGVGACIRYAFDSLGLTRVIAQIKQDNQHSLRVAQALGMRRYGSFVKIYQEKQMPHELYEIVK